MKTIKKTKNVLFLLILLACNAFSGFTKTVTKNYTVKEFSKLKIGSAFHVEFIQSNENKVTVEIDEDEAEDVYVANSGAELIIKMKDYTRNNSSVMKAIVYGKSLSALSVSGASHFASMVTFTEDIHLHASGASKVEISVNTQKLSSHLSGASKATVKGTATRQSIELSGASKYNAKNCKSVNIDIEASGASKAIVDCSDTLTAEASGASRIEYISKPKTVNQDTSGASEVELQ